MEHCEHHFKGAFVLLLMHVDGNASAIVYNGDRVVFVNCYFDMGAESCKSFVD